MPQWNVQAPDGKVIQFPDNFTEQDVNREMGKMYSAPAPNAGLAGPSRPNVDVQYQGSVPSRVLTAMGAAAGNLPNPIPGQGVGQYDPKTNQVSGLTPKPLSELSGAASGIHQMIAEPAQRIGGGDVAGGLGEAAVNIPVAGAMMKAAFDTAKFAAPSKARAQANYSDLTSKVGDQPIDVTASVQAAQDVKAFAGRGSQMPKVVRDFLRRMNDPAQPQPTYGELQDFASNASGKLADDIHGNPLKGKARYQMAKFASALRSDITAGAEQASPGAGDQYTQANREYAAASQMRTAAKQAVKVGATAGAGYAATDYLKRRFGLIF